VDLSGGSDPRGWRAVARTSGPPRSPWRNAKGGQRECARRLQQAPRRRRRRAVAAAAAGPGGWRQRPESLILWRTIAAPAVTLRKHWVHTRARNDRSSGLHLARTPPNTHAHFRDSAISPDSTHAPSSPPSPPKAVGGTAGRVCGYIMQPRRDALQREVEGSPFACPAKKRGKREKGGRLPPGPVMGHKAPEPGSGLHVGPGP
jgi:hypothetical protein